MSEHDKIKKKSEANTDACLNPQCGFEGLPFVPVPGGLCPRCGSQLSCGASGSGPPADHSARFRIRLIRYADTISAFEIEGVRGAWTWIQDQYGRIIRWGNVTTGHEPGERLGKLLEAAHFVWTVSGEPSPPWEWVIPEAEE